jgi:hypothetical protein
LASSSFHVPICGLWAKLKAVPAKHRATVKRSILAFMSFSCWMKYSVAV